MPRSLRTSNVLRHYFYFLPSPGGPVHQEARNVSSRFGLLDIICDPLTQPDFIHPFAAIGSNGLRKVHQTTRYFEISELPAK